MGYGLTDISSLTVKTYNYYNIDLIRSGKRSNFSNKYIMQSYYKLDCNVHISYRLSCSEDTRRGYEGK